MIIPGNVGIPFGCSVALSPLSFFLFTFQVKNLSLKSKSKHKNADCFSNLTVVLQTKAFIPLLSQGGTMINQINFY